jgi:chaperonin GroES
MKLSEIPFDDVKVGTRVRSDNTQNEGVVAVKYKQDGYKDFDQDGWIVIVDWDHGGSSFQRWYFYDRVEVLSIPEQKSTMSFQPTFDRVLVDPIDAEQVSPGGILLSDRTQSKTQQGTVVSVGNGTYQNAQLIPVRITVGSIVTFQRGAGLELQDGATKRLLLREGDILGTEV